MVPLDITFEASSWDDFHQQLAAVQNHASLSGTVPAPILGGARWVDGKLLVPARFNCSDYTQAIMVKMAT